MKKIIIFGAGNTGQIAFERLKKDYNIIAFSDNNKVLWGTEFLGRQIINPRDIKEMAVDYVVVASIYYVEIVHQLKKLGVHYLKVFQIGLNDEEKIWDIKEEGIFDFCKYNKIQADSNWTCAYPKEVNRRKKVLVIAYYFPPLGGSPIQRTLKFVKYLHDFGYDSVVLTVDVENDYARNNLDYSQIAEIPERTEIIRVKNEFLDSNVLNMLNTQEVFEFLYTISDSKKWMEKLKLAQATQWRYVLPDKLVLWANQCIRNIEKLIDLSQIDLLYSTVPEWSPHLIAYYLKEKFGIRWIADYRDPWVSNDTYVDLYYPLMTKEERELDKELEEKLVQKMDAIIVAGGVWGEDFIEKYNICSSKVVEITNGYDEEDFLNLRKKEEKNKKFTLCHNGNLGFNRNPIPVLRVINELIQDKKISNSEIEWILNGQVNKYRKELEKEDIYKIIKYNGQLPHLESVQIAMNADILVMYAEQGEWGYLNYPGKFYEYLRIGNPMLCFSSENSFQNKVLDETGTGQNMDLYDHTGIKSFILKHYKAWKEDIREISFGNDKIQRFERRNLTQSLVNIFDEIISK